MLDWLTTKPTDNWTFPAFGTTGTKVSQSNSLRHMDIHTKFYDNVHTSVWFKDDDLKLYVISRNGLACRCGALDVVFERY